MQWDVKPLPPAPIPPEIGDWKIFRQRVFFKRTVDNKMVFLGTVWYVARFEQFLCNCYEYGPHTRRDWLFHHGPYSYKPVEKYNSLVGIGV